MSLYAFLVLSGILALELLLHIMLQNMVLYKRCRSEAYDQWIHMFSFCSKTKDKKISLLIES